MEPRRRRRAGQCTTGHYGHTATLLGDGLVLIAGGLDDSMSESRVAELFDPKNGSFHRTGSMTQGRLGHAATLLADGRVLITGWSVPGATKVTSPELFCPTTGSFQPTGSMTTARSGETATMLADGRVLIAVPHAAAASATVEVAVGLTFAGGDENSPGGLPGAVCWRAVQ